MTCCLDGVHEEDRVIVRNAVAALQALKRDKVLSSWTVSTGVDGCYVVTAYLLDGVDCDFSARELDTIHDVSPLRVKTVSVGKHGSRVVIKVAILDRDQPLTLTETQVLLVRKRTRWASG